jgi:hypothetical protein
VVTICAQLVGTLLLAIYKESPKLGMKSCQIDGCIDSESFWLIYAFSVLALKEIEKQGKAMIGLYFELIN